MNRRATPPTDLTPVVQALGAALLSPSPGPLLQGLRAGTIPPPQAYHDLLRLTFRLLFRLLTGPDPSSLSHGLDSLAGLALDEPGLLAIVEKFRMGGGWGAHVLPPLDPPLRSAQEGSHVESSGVPASPFEPDAGRRTPDTGEPLARPQSIAVPLLSEAKGGIKGGQDVSAPGPRTAHTAETPPRHPLDDLAPLGESLERLLTLRPAFDLDAGTLALVGSPERKATGSYYTPPALVEPLLEMTLDPLLDRACAGPDPAAALLALTVCDPACGAGHLLAGAAWRIARRLAHVRASERPASEHAIRLALGEVVERCLYGIDLHPVAAELCRLRLARLSPGPDRALAALQERVRCGDSVGATDDGVRHDGVLGNPPFVNAIRGSLTPAARAALRRVYPEFGGTADLAYLMLGAALRLAAPGGRVGLVMPRGILNARAAERLRAGPPGGFWPARIWVPPRADHFPGATVFVALVAFAQTTNGTCKVCLEADPSRPASWHEGRLTSPNWWSETQAIAGQKGRKASQQDEVPHDGQATQPDGPPHDGQATQPDGPPHDRTANHGEANHHETNHREVAPPQALAGTCLGDRFEVAASMTAGDAYDVVPFVIDAVDGVGPRLITTGLIDPARSLWGERLCRYLRRDLRHPRVALGETASRSLTRRVLASRRPKILVAGLSRVVECFVDRAGEHIGAVSTYSIYHPRDDVDELEALGRYLLSDAVSERFRVVLGASALGGGNTTMRKDFLRQLPLPRG